MQHVSTGMHLYRLPFHEDVLTFLGRVETVSIIVEIMGKNVRLEIEEYKAAKLHLKLNIFIIHYKNQCVLPET